MAYVFTKGVLYTGGVGSASGIPLRALKDLLVTAGWTLYGSGSPVAPATSGLLDTITSDARMAGAGAYFLIQKPGSTGMFAVQNLVAAGTTVTIQYAPDGFVAPVSPGNDAVIPAGVTPAAVVPMVTNKSMFDAGGGGQQRVDMAADNASPYGWYLLGHRDGFVTITTEIFFDPLKAGSYPAQDTQPWVFGAAAGNAWLKAGLAQNNAMGNVPCAAGYLGAETLATNCMGLLAQTSGTVPSNLVVNPFSGNDQLFEILWVRPNTYTLLPTFGIKGVGTVVRWAAPSRSTADTLSVAGVGAKDYYRIGDICLPWDGTVPTL